MGRVQVSVTESTLWGRIKETERGRPHHLFTRFEVTTHVGVSDVEYLTEKWHGWIELKVMHAKRATSKVSFNSPFTLQQYLWLVQHHRPHCYLRSWLLVEWEQHGWFLISAPLTVRILREAPTIDTMLLWGRYNTSLTRLLEGLEE